MPLPMDLTEGLKRKIADLRNIGTGRGASSSVAALSLKKFVETMDWAHLDIAGASWSSKDSTVTGLGMRMLTKWAGGSASIFIKTGVLFRATEYVRGYYKL